MELPLKMCLPGSRQNRSVLSGTENHALRQFLPIQIYEGR
jgi:hypothetical protein